jgi:GTPase SAR1 family protein
MNEEIVTVKKSRKEKMKKIAIMGNTGAGKSVFLTSYFKYTTQDGEGKFSITLADNNSIENVSQMIQTLFIDNRPIKGTDKRYELNFSVSCQNFPDLTVELHDIPGGWTTSMDSWEDASIKIADDLRQADGVIFFVSVDELLNHPEDGNENKFKALQAFSNALNLLRDPQDNAKAPKKDIPVCIIFTKSDLCPDKSLEDLENLYTAFLKKAFTQKTTLKLFKTGERVKSWKTVAMGNWENADKPPTENRHENVIEPVEWLIESMVETEKTHRNRWIRLIGILVVCFFLAFVGIDQLIWHRAKTQINSLTANHEYQKAVEMLDKSDTRFFCKSLLPEFLTAGKDASELRKEIVAAEDVHNRGQLHQSAQKHYENIRLYIEGINLYEYPRMDVTYYDQAVKNLENYLAQSNYYKVTPDLYEDVRQILPSWKICYDIRKFDQEVESLSPAGDEAYPYLEKFLQMYESLPAEWQEQILPKIQTLLNDWYRGLEPSDSPEIIQSLLDRAENLKQYLVSSNQLHHKLDSWINRWHDQYLSLWQPLVAQWLNESDRMDTESAIRFLDEKKTDPLLPEIMRLKLNDRSSYYSGLKIQNELKELNQTIDRNRNLQELAKDAIPVLTEFKRNNPQSADQAQKLVEKKFAELKQQEEHEIRTKFGNYLASRDYDRAMEIIDIRMPQFLKHIERFDGHINLSDRMAMERFQDSLRAKLSNAEYYELKGSFRNLKTQRSPSKTSIGRVIEQTEQFLKRHSTSDFADEVNQVKRFLSKIQYGLKGDLLILESSCDISFLHRSKFRLTVTSNKEGTLMVAEEGGDNTIHWNKRREINWDPETIIEYKLERIPITPLKDDELLIDQKLQTNWLLGYDISEMTVSGKKECKIMSKIERVELPPLPDGWR